MSKRFWLGLFLVTGIIAGPAMAQSLVPIDPATVTDGHVYLMDNVGVNVPDDSANNNNGTLLGSPTAVAGLKGGALQFNGTSDGILLPDATTINTATHQNKTVIAVFHCADVSKSAKQCIYEEGGSTRGLTIYVHQGLVYAAGWNRGDYTPQWNPGTFLSAPIRSNEWHVVAAVLRNGTAGQADDKFEMWLDGALIAKGPGGEFRARSDDNGVANVQAQTNFHDGTVTGGGQWFEGMIDELWILNQALPEDVLSALGLNRTVAANPVPTNDAVDVPRDAVLAWEAGEFAGKHNVYLGTNFADVNSASVTTPLGALVGEGQTEATYEPTDALQYGQTYYWRVDEVNKAPDNTIFKGDVWSFTVEPYGYPVKPVAATASSFQAGMGPEKTIDGSGMTGDLHGTVETTMWLSIGVPPNWIQYEFDKVYKLSELWVWNSNQIIESFLGFGAKSVKIEYSTDGTTWTELTAATEFARAPGTADYAANTKVDLAGIWAKFVKLTINTTWGGLPQTGLSEVRFFHVPVLARAPQPAAGATGIDLETALDWRPGREATSHKVFFGTDVNAVTDGTAPAKTVTDHGYDTDSLTFGTKYFWRVDEVGEVTYAGDVWSFTTQEYAAVDDFESYTDEEGSRIYESWIDGWTNGTGSTVGHLQAPFAERTIIHGGKQAMPLEYNNVKTPFYSEAEREFSPTENWTLNAADTLSLWIRGNPAAYVENAGVVTMSGGGHDIWDNADDFRFAYKSLNGNGSVLVKVESLVNTNAWAKAGVMIRETLDAGSKHAFMAVTPGNSCSAQRRDTTDGASASTNWSSTAVTAPYWVRVTRTGNVFKSESSPDGKTWTALGADVTITMAANVYIGLAVTSHNAAATTTAVMSGAATTGNVTGSWQVAAIGDDPQAANTPADLYLTVEDKAGKKKTVVDPNPAATTTTAWTQWRIPLSDLSSAGVNLTAVKKITLGVGDRTSPKAGAAGMLYIDDIGFGRPAQ